MAGVFPAAQDAVGLPGNEVVGSTAVGRAAMGSAAALPVRNADILYAGPSYWQRLLGAFLSLFPDASRPAAAIAITLFLGVLAALLFYRVVGEFLSEREAGIALLLLVSSPVFIIAFLGLSSAAPALVLLLLGAYGLLVWWPAALAALLLLPLSLQLSCAFVVLAFATVHRHKGRWLVPLLLVLTIAFAWYSPVREPLVPWPGIFLLLADFGSVVGFGVFHVLCAMVGAVAGWRLKKRYPGAYLAGIILMVLFVAGFFSLRILLDLLFALLGGIGLAHLMAMSWDDQMVRRFTLFLILLGIVFSYTSYTTLLVRSFPDRTALDVFSSMPGIPALTVLPATPAQDQARALPLLSSALGTGDLQTPLQTPLQSPSQNPLEDSLPPSGMRDRVLSQERYGIVLRAIAGREPFIDTVSTPGQKAKADELFSTRGYAKLKMELRAAGVRDILVTQDMRSGLVWAAEDDGMLFLLGKAPGLEKVMDEPPYELWHVQAADALQATDEPFAGLPVDTQAAGAQGGASNQVSDQASSQVAGQEQQPKVVV
ncbi:hypothetical protein COY28_01105 [Candidatus Woesearchaeota archaeon CG_4_10_14_0_2_um_filter_57_5]|nr:MAG: hypothetical protein COY28_01105 [Candidatus Woesearchaeota archaeon CG_4_10_14_0_2_um_filter_57_5]